MSSLPSEPRAAAAEPQADARTAEVGIERLPGSLLQNIFGFLDAASVRQAAAVSQTWSGLAHDLDNVLYDRARAERELEAMRRRFQNDGFRESVDEAREAQLQRGFDEGFVQGMAEGLRTGETLGIGLALALMQLRRQTLSASSSNTQADSPQQQQQQQVRHAFERLVELQETDQPPAPGVGVNPSIAFQQQQQQQQLNSAGASSVVLPSRARQAVAVDLLDNDLGDPPNGSSAASLGEMESDNLFGLGESAGSAPLADAAAVAMVVARPPQLGSVNLQAMGSLGIAQVLTQTSPELSADQRRILLHHLQG